MKYRSNAKQSLFVIASAFILFGCGGGGSPTVVKSTNGTASLIIKWPSRARLIPLTSNSVTVSLSQNGKVVTTQTVSRPLSSPTSTVTFTDLNYGTFAVSATSFPNSDGTGIAQATGAGTLTETPGTPGTVTVSMASTVATLTVTPKSIVCYKGMTTTLTASAQDSLGEIVLLAVGSAQEALTWSTTDSSIATVSGTGPTATLTGVDQGTTTVTASFVVNDAGSTVTGQNSAPVTAGTGTVTVQ
jgi:hypothetical protein